MLTMVLAHIIIIILHLMHCLSFEIIQLYISFAKNIYYVFFFWAPKLFINSS